MKSIKVTSIWALAVFLVQPGSSVDIGSHPISWSGLGTDVSIDDPPAIPVPTWEGRIELGNTLYETLHLDPLQTDKITHKHVGRDICPQKFKEFYRNIRSKYLICKDYALIIKNVEATQARQAEGEFGFPNVVVKVQDIGIYPTKYVQHKGPLESSEIAVGFVLNDLMLKYNPSGVPKSPKEVQQDENEPPSTDYSRYIGFVKTLDFAHCNLNPIAEFLPDSQTYKKWVFANEKIRGSGPYQQSKSLYIIMEQLSGQTFTNYLLDQKWICSHDAAWKNAAEITRRMDEPGYLDIIRPNLDPLRSFLIQVLSTLWYSTEIDFTHWDLHSSNIFSTKVEAPDETWSFDFLPFHDPMRLDASADPRTFYSEDNDARLYQPPQGQASRKVSAYTTGDVGNVRGEGSVINGRNSVRMEQSTSRFPAAKNMGDITRNPKTEPGVPGGKRNNGPFNPFKHIASFVINTVTAGAFQRKGEMEYVSDDAGDYDKKDESPLLSFHVPSSATKQMLFKIIDFGRSRAVNKATGEPFYSVYDTYNPFADLQLIAYDIISRLPERLIRLPLSKQYSHLPQDFQDAVAEDYADLDAVLQLMLGVHMMKEDKLEERLQAAVIEDLNLDKSAFDVHWWFKLLHSAIKMTLPPTAQNKHGESRTARLLTGEWIFREGSPNPYVKMQLKQEFRRNIIQVLKHNFFKKFRV